MNWAAERPGTRSSRRPSGQAKLVRVTRKARDCNGPAHEPAGSVTRTPPKSGASDHKVAHPVTNDSEAGRALGRAAAGTSGHAQQHARSAAAMQHASWCPEPGRTDAASKLTCRVTGPRTIGTRKNGSASGPRDRIRTFIKEAYCLTTGAAVHSQLRAGLQPGRPFFGFPRGVGGPGRRHENYGLSENEVSVWLASTVFFRTHPPTAAQNYQ